VQRLKLGSTTQGKSVDAVRSGDGCADGASKRRAAMPQCARQGTRPSQA
jgi:hypothetical protein